MRPFVTAVGLSLVACSASPPSNLFAALERCGLASAGSNPDGVIARSLFAPDACYRDCLAEGTCDELRATLCRTDVALRVRCDERCGFGCPDGGIIAQSAVCNGAIDCPGGADEAGCPGHDAGTPSTCDGRPLPLGAVCNGFPDCTDSSDERGCPGDCVVNDGSGRWLSRRYYRCDGHTQCIDGSDELGCQTFTCGSTTLRIDPTTPESSPLCDGYMQCADGADERGCAMLTAHCSP